MKFKTRSRSIGIHENSPNLRVSSFQFPVSSFQFPVSSFQFPVSSFKFQVSSFKFQVSSFQFQVSSFKFSVWLTITKMRCIIFFITGLQSFVVLLRGISDKIHISLGPQK
ncbi:Uncharacterized protein dnm_081020 [Desulfonema magnum]|uniref:Uncharacterized protein n=1 Tax=Desulfonema magnum TaxID=45655 RepID=A0A975BVF7_9BACT|nr:Uncharacterized protein dnm_081020 [Desulfonema magnum]